MKLHRLIRALVTPLAIALNLIGVQASAQQSPDPIARLNEAGPEAQALARRVGLWDVSVTSWASPSAAPVVVNGLVAERRMIGPMLEEIVHPVGGAPEASFSRADFLHFDRLEGRWQYMSMDSQLPVGLMFAWSLDADPEQRVTMSFLPFAVPVVSGSNVVGQLFRMEQVIARQDADHETKDQYFIAAGNTATKWLAKRYNYTRRK